jgi:hypothetical protein
MFYLVPGTPALGGPQVKQIPHNSRETTQAVERITSWLVPTAIIEDELRLQMVRNCLIFVSTRI